jgi:acetyl esterase/lipase
MTSSGNGENRTYELDVRDVEYLHDGHESILARVYQPRGSGPFPALVYIHGGAWSSNDRTTNPGLPWGVAARGVVVVAIDFRQGVEHPYPSSLIDINYATRWLKKHAGDFNAIPGSVGGMGASSGGHLIMLSAMRPRDSRYTAIAFDEAPEAGASLAYVISCFGVLDPYGRYRMAEQNGNKEMMARHDAYFGSIETQKEASCLLVLERGEKAELPPALLIQGTADTGVPKGMIEEFDARYRAAGGQAELALFEGMPHGIWDWPPEQIERAIDRIQAFIARQLATSVQQSAIG